MSKNVAIAFLLLVILIGGVWWYSREQKWERAVRDTGKDVTAMCTKRIARFGKDALEKCDAALWKVRRVWEGRLEKCRGGD